MDRQLDRTIKSLATTIKNYTKKGTYAYDSTAEVIRVSGETAYVKLPGSNTETPVKLTINAEKGDKVQVRLSGGNAWIIGNITSPPTDDKTANEAKANLSYYVDLLENTEFGKGEDGKNAPVIEKIEFQYCLSDSDKLNEDGEVDIIVPEQYEDTDGWMNHVPTMADVSTDEDGYEVEEIEADEIPLIKTDGYINIDAKEIDYVKVNGTNYTDYTIIEDPDWEEGDEVSYVIKINKSTWPASVTSVEVRYIANSSDDEDEIYYIWMRTLTYMSEVDSESDEEDNSDESEDGIIYGTPILYGSISNSSQDQQFLVRTIIREETQYCQANAVTIPSGKTFEDIQQTEWLTTAPEYDRSLYYWTRIKYYFSDGTIEYSYPRYDATAQVAAEVADAESSTDNHFWHDSTGAYVSHTENDKVNGAVMRAVSEGILLTYNNQTLASFTQSGIQFRDSSGNIMVTYANGGISFNPDIPFTIGNDKSFIKWIKEDNQWKVKIVADTISMGGSDVITEQDQLTVDSVEYAYQLSTSGTTPPTGTWSTTPVAPTSSQYAWTRTTTKYSDGSTAVSYTVGGKGGTDGQKGADGDDGRGIRSTTISYASSTSATSVPSSFPYSSPPSVSEGSYLWTKTTLTYTDGTSTNSYSVAKQGERGADTSSAYFTFNPTGTYKGVQVFSGTKTDSTYSTNFSLMSPSEFSIWTSSMKRASFSALELHLGLTAAEAKLFLCDDRFYIKGRNLDPWGDSGSTMYIGVDKIDVTGYSRGIYLSTLPETKAFTNSSSSTSYAEASIFISEANADTSSSMPMIEMVATKANGGDNARLTLMADSGAAGLFGEKELSLASNKKMYFYLPSSTYDTFLWMWGDQEIIKFNYVADGSPKYHLQFPHSYYGSGSGKAAYLTSNGWLNVNTSTRKIKREIRYDFDEETDPHQIYNLRVARFKYIDTYLETNDYKRGRNILGFIAEDVDEDFKLAAYHENDGKPTDWDYRIIIPAMVSIIQEQHADIEELKTALKEVN